jgi:Holliday junction resolvase RusA-like endonuclease
VIVLDLPIPPSVNAIWRKNRNAVYLSAKYVAWRDAADVAVMAVGGARSIGKIAGKFTATRQINEKMVRKGRDLDNFFKPLLDYCRRIELIDDDNLQICRLLTIEVDESDNPSPLGCRIILKSLD